ncbi:MAG: hypothetical protein J5I59_05410 [Saprospiraceae bacterium]|nr:hypothetical protein [Saprospiraceae bacterium]
MFKSKYFWIQVGLMVGSVLALVAITLFILRIYTHHGEKIPITRLINLDYTLASTMAKNDGFEVVVSDSVFVVGKKGGIILAQNPEEGTFAKEGRKIYVTLTKYSPDMIPVNTLPALYGKSYELKSKVLLEGFEIQSSIVGRMYDKGVPGQILKVIYGNDTIINEDGIKDKVSLPRGAKLKFIVSTQEGGQVMIPDFVCKMYDEAVFLAGNDLHLSVISGEGGKYVVSQQPEFIPDTKINRGDTIFVTLSNTLPPGCPAFEDE